MILGLFALLIGADAISTVIPQFHDIVAYIAGLSILSLVLLFVLLVLGIGGSAAFTRGVVDKEMALLSKKKWELDRLRLKLGMVELEWGKKQKARSKASKPMSEYDRWRLREYRRKMDRLTA